MLLAQTLQCKVDRKVSVGDLVERVAAALGETVPILVYLEEDWSKPTALARAISRIPALDALGPPRVGETERHILASLADEEAPRVTAQPVTTTTALAAARGIPRTFAFTTSHFAFGPVPSLWLAAGSPPPREHLAADSQVVPGEVLVRSRASHPRRETTLAICIGLDAPDATAKKLPPLPAATATLLAALGGMASTAQRLVPGADDLAQIRAARAEHDARGLDRALDPDERREISFPYLGGDDQPTWGDERFGPLQASLSEALHPHGYRHRSKLCSRGRWVLGKRTARRNESFVVVSRGPLNGEAQATLIVQGPLWNVYLTIPCGPERSRSTIWSEITGRHFAANLAAAVEHLERTRVTPLEALYPPGYAWFSRGSV